MCFSMTAFSNLFASKSNDGKFVYRPSNSKAGWFSVIVNLIIQVITQAVYMISRVMEAIKFIKT